MARDLKQRRPLLWASLGYVILSILGSLSAGRLFDVAPLAYILGQWILGPLAFAFNLRSESTGGSLFSLWILCYLAATALLILCVRLFRRGSRLVKGMAVLLAVLVWLASGLMNFMVMFRGI